MTTSSEANSTVSRQKQKQKQKQKQRIYVKSNDKPLKPLSNLKTSQSQTLAKPPALDQKKHRADANLDWKCVKGVAQDAWMYKRFVEMTSQNDICKEFKVNSSYLQLALDRHG